MDVQGAIGCIPEEDAVALVQGVLHTGDAERVRSHAEECAACRAVVAALARMPTVRGAVPVDTGVPTLVAPEGTDPLAVAPTLPGEMIAGRYIIGEVIGAGAMGIVYLARDTSLSRMVALKRV